MTSNPESRQWEVDCRTVHERLKNGEDFLFLDCREPDEYATASIVGAVLMPMSEIESRMEELSAHRAGNVVVHCHHGGRSLRVAYWLASQGFQDVKSMAGGIDRWSCEIDPSIPRY